jgi:hypothetical protein
VSLEEEFSANEELGIFDEGTFIRLTFSQYQDLERRKMVTEDKNPRHPDQRFVVHEASNAEDVRAYLGRKYWRSRNKRTMRFYNSHHKGDRRESEATVWLEIPPSALTEHEIVDEKGNPVPPLRE